MQEGDFILFSVWSFTTIYNQSESPWTVFHIPGNEQVGGVSIIFAYVSITVITNSSIWNHVLATRTNLMA